MIVQVWHQPRAGEGDNAPFTHVANVDVPDELATKQTYMAACEIAYTRTQNISGSWSRGPKIEYGGNLVYNDDYDPSVTVLVPLHKVHGVDYGLRSSMIGDRFVIDGDTYVCATFGFEPVSEGE